MSVPTLNGLSVVVTGTIAGETRASAEAKLSAAGAHVQPRVTKQTDVLVIGANVGRVKTDRARELGVQTITWAAAAELIAGGKPVPATAPPTAAPTRNQPVPAQDGYRQVKPMLCKKAEAIPGRGEWLYEVKWDGYRCIAHVNGTTILASRTGLDLSRFEHIVAELDQLTVPCILDGEIVALDEEGRSEFQRLHAGETLPKLVVFDVLDCQGHDIRSQPLHKRRELLTEILGGGVYVTESPVFTDGEALLAYARDKGLEGVVAKRADSHYREGGRTDAWLKIKLRQQQEFVVVGYTEGKGNRAGTAGALLLATWDPIGASGRFHGWQFHGSAGSGGTYEDFQEIVSRTTRDAEVGLTMKHDLTKAELRETTWVKPEVVVQVKFQRWTDDGKLWHPSIQGIRDDKEPKEVIRES